MEEGYISFVKPFLLATMIITGAVLAHYWTVSLEILLQKVACKHWDMTEYFMMMIIRQSWVLDPFCTTSWLHSFCFFFFFCRVDKRPHFILTFYLSAYNTGRACGGPWLNIRSQSSPPFTVRVPAVELGSLGVVTSTFTSWAIFTRMRLHFDPGDVCISFEK